jgi:succinyl-diaminopimelate desuccinylase
MTSDVCADTNCLLEVLRDLIGFQTVAPPGRFYNEVIDYAKKKFDEMGFATEKIVMPKEIFEVKCEDERLFGDRANLRARLDVGAMETLVIYTHLDVVPPGDGWTSDPFELTRKGDRFYGRGVSDSKGAVACLIAALEAFLKSGKPKYNITVLLTTDEEVGGYSGLCFFADEGLIEGDYMLCMDGFSDDVVIGSNGIITWEVAVKGRSVHSGSSFLGVNAIEKSIPVMEALMTLKADVQSRRSALKASSALESVGIGHLMPMLNITIIKGGIKENIVPDRCIIRGDRRVIPEESMESAISEIERTLKPLEADFDLRFFPGYPPMYVNPDHPWVETVRQAVKESAGVFQRISGAQGSLDQAYAQTRQGFRRASSELEGRWRRTSTGSMKTSGSLTWRATPGS